MAFDSIVFLLRFLPIFLICYYVVPGRMKNFILFLGSLCFYAWGNPFYIVLLLFIATTDYLQGLLIERCRKRRTAGILLGNALVIDIAVLLFFGYADLGIATINTLFGTALPKTGLPIPMGLTIFTLQSMSYVIGLYRGEVKLQKNYFDYLVYLTLFPQMLGGPIVQYGELEGRLHDRRIELHQVSRGLQRFCIGLAKKALLADILAETWKCVSVLDIGGISLGTAWLGIVAFGLQLYYSLSGFADMAIGLSMCLGFEYPENFSHPFAAASVTEFANCWNISLMNWIRKFVHAPMTGEKCGGILQFIALFVSGALIGLWYGPDLTFLLCGIWMAFFYMFEKLFWGKVQKHLPGILNWIVTMIVVFAGLVFFAGNSLNEVWGYFLAMAGLGQGGLADRRFWYLMAEYLPYVVLGVLLAMPYLSTMANKMRQSKSVLFIAVYRLLEKTIPAILLIVSLVKIAAS